MISDEVDALVHGLAVQVHRRYRGHIEFDDLLQQGREWCLRHPTRIAQWLEDENEKAGWASLSRAITRELGVHARKEKATRAGYSVDDESYYNVSILEAVLPAIFDPELEDAPPMGDEQEIRAPKQDAVSSVWPVHLADVRSAWSKADLTVQQRTALAQRYSDGLSLATIAHVMEMDMEACSDLLRGALRQLIDTLGGVREHSCGQACACEVAS